MKKIIALLLACGVLHSCFAQQDDNKKADDYGELKGGFKQENIFVGGTLNVGFGQGQLTLGGIPEVGYTFTPWLDAGLGINVIYTSIAANTYYNPTNTKLRQFTYGGGPFIRIYPVNFLFVQGQFEQNWTKVTIKQDIYTYRQTVNTSSLIAGIGYAQRELSQGNYYIMVGLDLLKHPYSPYVQENDVGQLVAQPIIRIGGNLYLKPSKAAAREQRYQSARIL